MPVTHTFNCLLPNDPDITALGGINISHWNATHTVSVGTSEIQDGSVTLAKLSTTGTPSSSTYLRGDGAWATVSGGISDGDKGDITVSSSGTVWTIDTGVVTTAKLGGDITTAGKALLDDADASAQRTTLGLGTLATQNGTFSGSSSGTNTGDQTITLTGDVTGSGTGSFAATIANSAVTYPKIQNVTATDRVLGRSSAGAGIVQEIVCTAFGRSLIDDTSSAAAQATLGLNFSSGAIPFGTGSALTSDATNFYFDPATQQFQVGPNTFDGNERVHLSPIAVTIQPPSNPMITYNSGGEGYPDNGYTHDYQIYSYRTLNGTTFYSSSGATVGFTDPNTGTETYNLTVSWDAVPDAEGYIILVADTFNGYSFNYYRSTTDTSFVDNNTGWSSPSPDISVQTGYGKTLVADGTVEVDGNLNTTNLQVTGSGSIDALTSSSAGIASLQVTSALSTLFLTNGRLIYSDSGNVVSAAAMTYSPTGTHLTIQAQSAAHVPLVAKGAASGTGNLQQWQNSSASVLASISSSGALTCAGASLGTVSSGTWNGTAIGTSYGGTGATSANAGLNNLLPSQTGNSGKFLTTDGSNTSWATVSGSGTVTTVSVVSANGFAGSVANATTTPALTLSTSITGVLKGNGTALSAATAGTDYSAGTSALATGILKSTTSTGALTIAIAADFPTLNQNTTGSAATLTTARAIYGNNFDGSAALTQIIASTYGGTGNGFTKFSGPASSEKTFTLPNASATVLTDNAAVTVAQGGTGLATITANRLTKGNGTSALTVTGVTVGTNDELSGFRANVTTNASTTITLGSSDTGNVVETTSASAVAVTLSASATVGTSVTVTQAAAGQVTFAAGSGGSLRNRQSHTKTAAQWAVVTVYVRTNSGGSAAEWVLAGDTAA